MLIGYVSQSVRKLSRVAFWGIITALPSNINTCYSFQPAAPFLITEDLPGRWPGQQPLYTAQSERYYRLSSTTGFQAWFRAKLLARPGYMECWVESLCMKRFWLLYMWDGAQTENSTSWELVKPWKWWYQDHFLINKLVCMYINHQIEGFYWFISLLTEDISLIFLCCKQYSTSAPRPTRAVYFLKHCPGQLVCRKGLF
jgi:hypothetical protein